MSKFKSIYNLNYNFIFLTISIICLLCSLVFVQLLNLEERKVQNKLLKELSNKTDSLKTELIITRKREEIK